MTLEPSSVHSRVAIAFGDDTLEPAPTWVGLDAAYPNLVTSYQIDRGRQWELDRTDTGRATVEIADVDGVLDPTNAGSPYVGQIEPLKQVMLSRRNPVDGNWYVRYRGFVEEYQYEFHPSQRVNMLTLSLVDLFEILAAIEMQPWAADGTGFGDDPVTAGVPQSAGQVFFDSDAFDERINKVLDQSHIPVEFRSVFSGNVLLWGGPPYSPGESALTAIQDAADAEFVGVSNIYTDRFGRLAAHGREAKFDPGGVLSGLTDPDLWLWHTWNAGDAAALDGATAHLRRFSVNRGMTRIINTAKCTPVANPDAKQLTPAEDAAQLVKDTASIGHYGIRSWSAENLLTLQGQIGITDCLAETRRFASYYVGNYASPANRITDIQFRSMRLGQPGAIVTWNLLCKVDISDEIFVTVGSPGGGGIDHAQYYVEGVHETAQPLNPDMDDVTVTLDLSPFPQTVDPWA